MINPQQRDNAKRKSKVGLSVLLSALLATTLMIPPIAWAEADSAAGVPEGAVVQETPLDSDSMTDGDDSAALDQEITATTETQEREAASGEDPASSDQAVGGAPSLLRATGTAPSTTAADVARIEGGASYATLKEAFDAAGEGDVIVMLDNVSISTEQMAEGSAYCRIKDKRITLDLAGKEIKFDMSTYTGGDGFNLFYIHSTGGLTVKDSGGNGSITTVSPQSGYSVRFLIDSYGSFSLESGTIRGTENVYYLLGLSGPNATISISGGTLDNQWGSASDGGVCIAANGKQVNEGYTLDISGGTIRGGEQTLYLPSAGTTTISGEPKLEGTGRAIEIRSGNLTISGGTFSAASARIDDAVANNSATGKYTGALVAVNPAAADKNGYAGDLNINVLGGTFTNASGDALCVVNEQKTTADPYFKVQANISAGTFTGNFNVSLPDSADEYLAITGGTYSADPSAYVVRGYKAVEEGGMYKIADAHEAAIGTQKYVTLQEAFDAAQSGDEIVLLNDVEANVTVPATASPVVLDLNGKTIAGAKSDEKYEKDTLTIQGSLTVKDSTVSQPPVVSGDFRSVTYSAGKILGKSPTKTPWPKAAVVQDGGSLILESGIIESEDSDAVFVKNNSTFTVKGGYIHSAEFGIGVQGEGATLNFEDGVVVADNNAAIGGNGQEQYADTTITVSGGQVISHISSSGYIACGIYHPQRGNLTISGGTVYADNGVGVLMRGGKLSMTGGTVMGSGSQSGKVGDSGVSISSNGIAIHEHEDYYDHNGIKATISAGTVKADAPALAAPKNDLMSLTGGSYSSDPTAFVAEGYYAEFANAMYTVKQKQKASIVFDTNGGSSVSSLEGYATDPISSRAMPTTTRDGYDFIGWTDSQGSSVSALPEKFTAGTTTYFAQWEKKITPSATPDTTIHVQVSQVSDDTSAPKPVVTDKAVQAAVSSAQSALETIKQGGTPKGMSADKAQEIRDAVNDMPADGAVKVIVSVNAEQRSDEHVTDTDKTSIGSVMTDDETVVYFDLSVAMTVQVLNPDGTTKTSVDNVPLSVVDEPLLIEIHVDPELIKNKAVRIAHVHNGVTEIIQPESINRETGVIRVYASAFSTYALLTSSTVTVTFESNGGSAVDPQTIPFGTTATRPGDPSRAGYVFAGWFRDSALTSSFDFASPLNSSITLYAKWTTEKHDPSLSVNTTKPADKPTPPPIIRYDELIKTGDPVGMLAAGIGALVVGALATAGAAALHRRRRSS